MTKVRIGNQSACYAATPMQPFEYAVVNRFDAFEWFPDKKAPGIGWDESEIDAGARSYIKDTALKHNIKLSVHASLQADPIGPAAHELIFREIKFAQDIGAALMNIHFILEKGTESYLEAINPIILQTAGAGIKLSIENTPLTGPDDFNSLFTMLGKKMGMTAPHVGMCLDLGHANLYGGTRNDYLKFIGLIQPHVPVIHMHMHENYGESDSHLTLFSGPAGRDTAGLCRVAELLKQRGFSGSLILEQWPEPHMLLNQARDRLDHIFNERK